MKALVPAGTYAVCTNGMHMGVMVVTSQRTVKNHKGKLIATLQDKPTNFSCVWAGFIVAVISALFLALATTLGPLAVILIATLAGVGGSLSVGSLMCYLCLKSIPWLPDSEHPHIKIVGNKTLLSTAQITCTPLGFLPSGSIQLYFDKSVASRISTLYRIKNLLFIFDGATVGTGIGSLYQIAKGVFLMVGKPLVGTIAAVGVISGLGVLGYGLGTSVESIQDYSSTFIADWLTDGEYSKGIKEDKSYDEDETLLSEVKLGVSNQPGDASLIAPYKNLPKIQKQYNIGTQAIGELMKTSWERIKADPIYQKGNISKAELNSLKSKYMKEVAKEISTRNAKLAKNTVLKKSVLKTAKEFLVVNGVCIGVNITGQTAINVLKVGKSKYTDKEVKALLKVGIYENKI